MPIRAVVLLASAFLAQGAATLRWAPKEGDTLRFRTSGDFTMAGVSVSITTVNDHKVIRVDPDGGFLVQATPIEGKVTMGGQEMSGKGITTLTSYLPSGEIKEIQGDRADATGYRMANLSNFHAPTKAVVVGDSWTSEGKADAKTGVLAWKAEYKVVGEETRDGFPAMKMEMTARETEGSDAGKVSGSIWVGKDGVVVRSELVWTNLAVPGAPAPVSGKYTLARIEMPKAPAQ